MPEVRSLQESDPEALVLSAPDIAARDQRLVSVRGENRVGTRFGRLPNAHQHRVAAVEQVEEELLRGQAEAGSAKHLRAEDHVVAKKVGHHHVSGPAADADFRRISREHFQADLTGSEAKFDG